MVQIHQLFTESEKIKVVYKCEQKESRADLILGHVWLKPHKFMKMHIAYAEPILNIHVVDYFSGHIYKQLLFFQIY